MTPRDTLARTLLAVAQGLPPDRVYWRYVDADERLRWRRVADHVLACERNAAEGMREAAKLACLGDDVGSLTDAAGAIGDLPLPGDVG